MAEGVGDRLPGDSAGKVGLFGILWPTTRFRQGSADADMPGMVEDGFDVIPAMPLPCGRLWVVFWICF
ncbi:hypothetical protein J3U06_09030 [Bifidobacterium sp. B4142]|nr:hypothetical protein [Bifidobacterium sp. B4142]